MNKFLLRKLVVFTVGFFLLFTSSAQQLQPNAINQIKSLMQEKELRTPAQKKMDSHLIYGAKMGRGERITSDVATLEENLNRDARGLVLVDIHGKINDVILQAITNAGGIIIFSSPRFNVVTARIPLQSAEGIAAIPEVKTINAAFPPRHAGNPVDLSGCKTVTTPVNKINRPNLFSLRPGFAERAARIRKQVLEALEKENLNTWHPLTGSVTSQGDATHRAAAARTTFGVNGAGIKIGVLSDSYNNKGGAAANVTSGDLPGATNPNGFTTPVNVLSDYPSGESDEGRAMLQIVHDIAPGAQLYFATAFTGEGAFAQNILNLRAAGCDIICDDVFYYDEPVFYDGIVAQAVNSVTNAGALYFSSAGNQGNKTDNTSSVWEGDFVDGGATSNPLPNGRLHAFSTGIKYDHLMATVNQIALSWSDPPGASANDYDLYVLNSSMSTVVASSTATQNGFQDPFEFISGSQASGRRIIILKKTTATVRALHLNTFGGGTSSSLSISTQGQTHGHSSAADAFSCAATPAASSFCGGVNYPAGPYPNSHNTSNKVECFSSDGPRRKFYNAAGAAITPGNLLFATAGGALLQKPDISAADGVATSGFASTTGLNPFYGTSAAAPHAAAIAALIKQFSPGLTTAQLRNTITSTAIDIEAGGPDRNSGYGIIMAYEAIQSLPANGTTLEAEDAVLGGAVIASNQPGFTGSGFADYIHASGDFVEWTVNASAAGSFSLQFRYANGGAANRPLQLKVNGGAANANLDFQPTGSWTNWSVSSTTSNLLAGTNKVRLTAIGSSGPNVDNLKVDIVPCQSGTLEAEQALLSGAVVASNQPGFTGTGFADYINASNDFIEWTLNASAAGSFSLQFRYANGGATNRPLQLKVNDVVVNASFAFSPTGGWTNWSVSSATANLLIGTNKVRLTAIGSSGPNVDNLAFSCTSSMQLVQRTVPGINLLPASTDFLSAYVAPNPVSGNTTLILSASSHLPVNLQLVDILGRRYKSLKLIPGGSNTFDLSVNDLSPGSYIIILKQGNLSAHARLIVARK